MRATGTNRRAAALLVATVVAGATLTACGSDSDYCAAVKDQQSTLDTFGKKETDAGFAKYERTTRSLAKLAPAGARKDWTALSAAVRDVRDAQDAVGLKLQDVSADSLKTLSPEQTESLNGAYAAFTKASAKHGSRLKKSVKSECGVDLR